MNEEEFTSPFFKTEEERDMAMELLEYLVRTASVEDLTEEITEIETIQ